MDHAEFSFVGIVTEPGPDFDYRIVGRIPGKTAVVLVTEDGDTDFLVYCGLPPLPGKRVALRGVWFFMERVFPSGAVVCESQLDVESWVELEEGQRPGWVQNFVELHH